MAETDLRSTVIKLLRPLDAFAVENPANPGTPDVNFMEGWIELKRIDRWPVDAEHFPGRNITRNEQRVCLMRRWCKGGRCMLLLKVERSQEWLLFDGETAATKFGRVTRDELYSLARKSWKGTPSRDDFILHVLRCTPSDDIEDLE